MKNVMKNQRGVSYVGIFFGVIFFLLVFQAVMVVWPVYYDDYAMSENIQSALDASTPSTSDTQIKNDLVRRFDMNNIRDVPIDDMLEVTVDGGLKIRKKYEVKKHYFKNLYFLVAFDTTYQKGKEPVQNEIDLEAERKKVSLN